MTAPHSTPKSSAHRDTGYSVLSVAPRQKRTTHYRQCASMLCPTTEHAVETYNTNRTHLELFHQLFVHRSRPCRDTRTRPLCSPRHMHSVSRSTQILEANTRTATSRNHCQDGRRFRSTDELPAWAFQRLHASTTTAPWEPLADCTHTVSPQPQCNALAATPEHKPSHGGSATGAPACCNLHQFSPSSKDLYFLQSHAAQASIQGRHDGSYCCTCMSYNVEQHRSNPGTLKTLKQTMRNFITRHGVRTRYNYRNDYFFIIYW